MFSKEEYKKRLNNIGLSQEQIVKLRDVLDEMLTLSDKIANKTDSDYFYGKSMGINAVDRFLRGDMDCHDEFE